MSRLAVSREARARYQGWRQCTEGLVDDYRRAISTRVSAQDAIANVAPAAR